MQSATLHDRDPERVRFLDALSSNSRILVAGPPEAEVSWFVEWIVAKCAAGRTLIRWDFEKAPGVEGIDILKELADALPDASKFKAELSAVQSEFGLTPQTHVLQLVGEHAEAGHNQTFTAETNVPNLADYLRRNLHRLARAFFQDVRFAAEQQHVLFILSGIQVQADDPMPSEDLLDVMLSTIWRLAEKCSAKRLCVVLAATAVNKAALKFRGTFAECVLGLVAIENAVAAFEAAVPKLNHSEALAVVLSAAVPGTGGLTYTELRERIAYLALNRLESTLDD